MKETKKDMMKETTQYDLNLKSIDRFKLEGRVHKTNNGEIYYDSLILLEKVDNERYNKFDCGSIVEVNSYEDLVVTIVKFVEYEKISMKLKIEFKDEEVRKSFIECLESKVILA